VENCQAARVCGRAAAWDKPRSGQNTGSAHDAGQCRKSDAGGRELFSGIHFGMYGWGKSGRGLPQSKTWRMFGAARRTRSVLECASPLALWNGAIANSNVAADVSPLIIPAGEKFEPTHVGCYTFRMPPGQRGAGLAL